MPIAITHPFVSPRADGVDSTQVQPSNWNAAHSITMATARLIGRTTAGAGAAEEISIGSGLTMTGLTLSLNSTVSITALTASGAISGASASFSGALSAASASFTGTGAVTLPVGTTAQRPANAAGLIRFNSTLGQFEGNTGSNWGSIGGGATGGGSDQIFTLNDQTITTSYTIPSGRNALTAGPVTIASSQTVTVPNGSVWTIL